MSVESNESNKRGLYKAVGIIEALPNNPEWNYGGKVCLPPQCLERIVGSGRNIPRLMVFDVASSTKKNLRVKCGVIDFTAADGEIWMPEWMLKSLDFPAKVVVTLMAGEEVPKATSLLFQLLDHDLLKLGAKVILERHLRSFPILSQGEVIPIEFNGKIYPLKIAKAEPFGGHVITVDTDIAVDFVCPQEDQEDNWEPPFSRLTVGHLELFRQLSRFKGLGICKGHKAPNDRLCISVFSQINWPPAYLNTIEFLDPGN